MTTVEIANDLLIAPEDFGTGLIVAVETSQPVSMTGASVARIHGILQEADAPTGDLCRVQVQGSNELHRWKTLSTQDLPPAASAPAAFGTPNVSVPYKYARARWLVYPTVAAVEPCPAGIDPGTYFLVTAHMGTTL